jgi:hypothetical protein
MKLQTPVVDSPCKVEISYKDKILMLGSCFTDNIGGQLKNYGFNVCVNPFGTLYNPASVLAAVQRLISREPFKETECVQIGAGDMRFCSYSHHTSFARATAQEFLANANKALEEAAEFFRNCNKVIITLGTSWCYRHIQSDMIVSNCLKHPAAEYDREFLPASQTADILTEIMNLANGSDDCITPKEFIFTVSPIRHFKDGAHGNQISKASLLVGINQVLNAKDVCKADYFPSYEIMMDELRDYRFYAEDMCHPTLQTVNYIRERFLSWALPASEHSLLEENIKSFKRQSHISLQ